jgi:hypothetical protein
MSDRGKPMQPEHVFKKIVWRSTLALGSSLEQATTWTITGLAAIIGLFISKLDSVSRIVTPWGLRWSLILFACSLFVGAMSKLIGMAVENGLQTLQNMERLLESEEGAKLMQAMTVKPDELPEQLAKPFLWPISTLMLKGGQKGLDDYLSPDKKFIKMFYLQLYLNFFHGLLVLGGLITLAISIRYTGPLCK